MKKCLALSLVLFFSFTQNFVNAQEKGAQNNARRETSFEKNVLIDMNALKSKQLIAIPDSALCSLSKEETDKYGFDRNRCNVQVQQVKKGEAIDVGFTLFTMPKYKLVSSDQKNDKKGVEGGIAFFLPWKTNIDQKSVNFGAIGTHSLSTGKFSFDKAYLELVSKSLKDSSGQALHLNYSENPSASKNWEATFGSTLFETNQKVPHGQNLALEFAPALQYTAGISLEGGFVVYSKLKDKDPNYPTGLFQIVAKNNYMYCADLTKDSKNLFCLNLLGAIQFRGISGNPFTLGFEGGAGLKYARKLAVDDSGRGTYLYVGPEISGEYSNLNIGQAKAGLVLGVTK